MKTIFFKIFSYDRLINGLLLGLFFPITIFALLIIIFESTGLLRSGTEDQSIHLLRPRTIALIALCVNALLMNLLSKMRWFQSMRGLTISTFICVVLWLVKYYKDLW
jgi:Ca2+/Na+ antiporter